MMQTETPPNAPPLPHLVGPPPVPSHAKRARFGLAVSGAAWGALIGSLVLIGWVAFSKNASPAPSTSILAAARTTSIVLLFTVSPFLGFFGVILGISTRKYRSGTAALVVGGLNMLTWAAIIAAAMHSLSRHHR